MYCTFIVGYIAGRLFSEIVELEQSIGSGVRRRRRRTLDLGTRFLQGRRK